MTSRHKDPAAFEIAKNALFKIAEEMRVILCKTAYSPILKSAGDFSCGVFDATGAMDFELREAEIARAMVAQARRITVIADDTKLNRSALFRVCQLSDIHRIVLNAYPDAQLADAFRAAGVEIVTPDTDEKVA